MSKPALSSAATARALIDSFTSSQSVSYVEIRNRLIPFAANGAVSEEATPVTSNGIGPSSWNAIQPRSATTSTGTDDSSQTIDSSSGVRVMVRNAPRGHSGDGISTASLQTARRAGNWVSFNAR